MAKWIADHPRLTTHVESIKRSRRIYETQMIHLEPKATIPTDIEDCLL